MMTTTTGSMKLTICIQLGTNAQDMHNMFTQNVKLLSFFIKKIDSINI